MNPSAPRQGVLAALWTPTDDDGRLLESALAAHLAWLRTRGVHGILALGSTGDFPRFTVDERKAILESIAVLAAPLPVIANITDLRPRAVAELGTFARRLGLPAVAVMAPGFYPLTQSDLLAYFLHAAEKADLPVFLYNFPEMAGTRVDLETVAAFADRAPMTGIKQSGAEIPYHRDLARLGREKNFAVFSGADTHLPEAFALGAAGCIGGLANFVPELMTEVFEICRLGAAGDPSIPVRRLMEVGAILDRLSFPINVAAAIEARGLNPGTPRTLLSPESARLYQRVVTELRSHFGAWDLEPAEPLGSTSS